MWHYISADVVKKEPIIFEALAQRVFHFRWSAFTVGVGGYIKLLNFSKDLSDGHFTSSCSFAVWMGDGEPDSEP